MLPMPRRAPAREAHAGPARARAPLRTRRRAEYLPALKKVDGVAGVQRVVCGGCKDFKVVIKLAADKFGPFEEGGFAGEATFLEKLGKIPGVSAVETQTYTLEDM